MRRKMLLLWVSCSVLVISLGVALFFGGSKMARADGAGWLVGAPQVQEIGAVDHSAVVYQGPAECTDMTLPVVHSLYQQLFTKNEDHCMVRTSAGLVEEYAKVIQPNGFDKAYPIDSISLGGGHPVVVPVPNQPSALLMKGDPVYPGVNFGLFRGLQSHLEFNNNLLSPRFKMTGPDLYLQYPNGRAMAFNTSTVTFSSDGTYMVAEAISYGFVRINLTTLTMTAFALNAQKTSAGYPLGSVTAISPSGKYAAIAYNAPGGWGQKFFRIIDIDSCGNTSAGYDANITTCQSQNYLPDLQQEIPGLLTIGKVQFANDNSLNFIASTQDSSGVYAYTRYELTARWYATTTRTILGTG